MSSIWTAQNLGANISGIVAADDAQDERMLAFQRGTTEPTGLGKPTGAVWDCTGGSVLTTLNTGGLTLTEAYGRWNGSAWTLLFDPAHACINRGGTVPFGANQPMGSHKLTGLAAGTANGDSVRYEQVVRVDSGGELVQDLDAGGFKIVDLGAPASANDAATKAYVDASVPSSVGALVYKTNRDSTNPIVLRTDGGSEKVVLGAMPREVVLRVTGDPRRQDDNNAVGAADLVGVEQRFIRWEADAGGEAGTITVTKSMGDLDVTVEFVSDGFVLTFKYAGIWVTVKKIGDPATAGSIAAICTWAVGDEA